MLKKYFKIWFILKLSFFVVASFIAGQIIVVGMFLAVNKFFNMTNLNNNFLQIIMTLITYAITLFLIIIIYRKILKQKISLGDVGFNRFPDWGDIALAIPVFIVYSLASSFSIILLSTLLPSFNTSQQQQVGFKAFGGRLEYIFVFLLIAFLTPLFEETLFRGFFLKHLEKKISPKLAIFIVSLVFAILHINWVSVFQSFSWDLIFSHIIVDIFIFALTLGYLVKITGSIWASILLHVLKNSVAFMVLFLFK